MATDTVTIVTFINTNFTPNAVLLAITEEQLKKKSLNLKIGKTFFFMFMFLACLKSLFLFQLVLFYYLKQNKSQGFTLSETTPVTAKISHLHFWQE